MTSATTSNPPIGIANAIAYRWLSVAGSSLQRACLLWGLIGAVHAAPKVAIEGLDEPLRKNALAYLNVDVLRCDTAPWQIDDRLDKLEQNVKDALKPFGYYTPSVEVERLGGDTCWSLAVKVRRGEQVLFRQVDVSIDGDAASLPAIQSLAGREPKPGDPALHQRYEALKRSLQLTLSNFGFLDARFTKRELNVFPTEQAADVVLHVQSGERYRYGNIRLDQEVLDDDLIRRYVTLEPGGFYDRSALDQLQADLSATTFFNRVLVSPDFEAAADGIVPINVSLTAAEKLGYFVGVGASTDQGPRVRGGYRNRRVNGKGHQFDSGLLYSPVLSQLQATYRQPLKNPLVEWQTIELLFESEETDTAEDQRFQLGVERTRALRNDWLFSYGISIGESRFTVADVTDNATLLIPVMGLSRRVSDNAANPRKGSSLEMRLRGATASLLSSTDFLQAYVRYRRLIPIGERGRLSLRGELGATWQQSFEELPPSVRFFAGGDNSVRGYGYQRIGPTNDDGEVIGGSQLATASIEYEHTLKGAWGVAAFVDSGNAFNDANIDPRTGVGLGVVWRSPVGPLRAYLAKPLDDDGLRLHINFGVDL
ncbi:MAG: autotransporter assembly complex family protein [Woeseiaceae bacterium]